MTRDIAAVAIVAIFVLLLCGCCAAVELAHKPRARELGRTIMAALTGVTVAARRRHF